MTRNDSSSDANYSTQYWAQLPFDYHPAKYMFFARVKLPGEWAEGEIRPLEDLLLSPAAAVLNYGQAAFEGMKALRTPQGKVVLFRPFDNARRFQRSASRLVMPPYPVDRFVAAVEAVVRANADYIPPYISARELHRQPSLYIRPVMIGSGPVLGVKPASEYTFYIIVSPVGPFLPGNGWLMVPDAAHRATPFGTGDIKAAANYAGTLLPQKLKPEGYKDVLYLDARSNENIEELSSSNFFAVLKDGTLITPKLGSILPGITRDSVIRIARELLEMRVEERDILIDEVLTSTAEAFFTGTAAVIQPITKIAYRGTTHTIGPSDEQMGKTTQELSNCLVEIQTQQQADPFGWVREVSI
ncbi:MAG TPA: branched-chain amino acid aminotransferase [Chloroflexia bacterium]|nr:branched-chain amino acid aminotransferase [Chloroflexia bacterium]